MSYELGQGTGPLRGVKVVEIAGIGPGPHACMILADLGADVIRIDRPGGGMFASGRRTTCSTAAGRASRSTSSSRTAVETVLDLVEGADVLVEGMRPGAMRAARARPGRLPRPQRAAGLRPDDRLGPGRPVAPRPPATT